MNKKDLIQALGVGVVFGLVIYCFMMVAVHFIEKQVDYESVYPSIEFDFLEAVEAVEAVSERKQLIRKNIKSDALVPILVKAIQELSAKVTALENA